MLLLVQFQHPVNQFHHLVVPGLVGLPEFQATAASYHVASLPTLRKALSVATRSFSPRRVKLQVNRLGSGFLQIAQ
jgi:hypothetical protein